MYQTDNIGLMDFYHTPVLLNETIEYLKVTKGERYIDCTLGGGGHTEEILRAGGTVLGIDHDWEALNYVAENNKEEIRDKKLYLRHANFAHLKEIALEQGFGQVAGVLFDLGVSSHQLEANHRGFSFNQDSPLDMRMDPDSQEVTAADLVNAASVNELTNILWRFGEEHNSRKIAAAIVSARKNNPITSTRQLAEVVQSVHRKGKYDRTHPATRTFQALRLAVNDELADLQKSLPQAVDLLISGGRLVIISFHSLEDRIVKNFIQENQSALANLTKKVVVPKKEEIEKNPRARSGKLRAAQKK